MCPDLATFRAEYSVRGYCLVGSLPLLQTQPAEEVNESMDADVVLLADGTEGCGPTSPLNAVVLRCVTTLRSPVLTTLLTTAASLRHAVIFYVHATVPIVKIQRQSDSVDVSWVDGCWFSHDEQDFRFRRFDVDDPDVHVPKNPSFRGPVSCVRLTRLFLTYLLSEASSFSIPHTRPFLKAKKSRVTVASRNTVMGKGATHLWLTLWVSRQFLPKKRNRLVSTPEDQHGQPCSLPIAAGAIPQRCIPTIHRR